MSVVVVGSVALDSVKTPFGERTEALGGSAVYFSYAASFFSDVQLVGVVGRDFPQKYLNLLRRRKIDLDGLHVVAGDTFRWSGYYEYDLNEAKTLDTRLNVFEKFSRSSRELPFGGLRVFGQHRSRPATARSSPGSAAETGGRGYHELMDLHQERTAKSPLSGNRYLDFKRWGGAAVVGAGQLDSGGATYSVLGASVCGGEKRGTWGTAFFQTECVQRPRLYPLEEVFDPTGAGDTFAGGFSGIFEQSGNRLDEGTLHQALFYGTVMASFTVERFSLERLLTVRPDIRRRLALLHHMSRPRD